MSIDDDSGGNRRDVRVFIRVKNANILRRMEDAGIASVTQLARESGISLGCLHNLINMRDAARRAKNGDEWRETAARLSEFFKCLPEDLFSEHQQYNEMEDNTASRDMASGEIMSLLESRHQANPEELLMREEGHRTLNDILASRLTPRAHRVIAMRYGLDGSKPMTLDEVGQKFSVTRERVRQMELRAIRDIKTASRKRLSQYLPEMLGDASV